MSTTGQIVLPEHLRHGLSQENGLVMAWARHRDTGELRYILELAESGARCNCVCISCGQPLTAVNAAKQRYHRRPHFRHPEGATKSACLVQAARAAIIQALRETGMLQLPRRRRSAVVQGFSGELHEAWVDHPPETAKIVDIDFRDIIQGVVTLEDGRRLEVTLVGSTDGQVHDCVTARIDILVDDPAIAAMSLDEIRKRLVPLMDESCWRGHWADNELDTLAQAEARKKASDELDWDDASDLPEDTPADARRETLLHRLVKEILSRSRRIRLPSLHLEVMRQFDDGGYGLRHQIPEKWVSLSDTVLERRMGRIVPDVIAKQSNGQLLLIEVTVTNPISEERLARIRGEGHAAIEIDMGRMGGRVTRAGLEDLVVREVAGKRWLHHTDAAGIEVRLYREIDQQRAQDEESRQGEYLASLYGADEWAERFLNEIELMLQCRVAEDCTGEDHGAADYHEQEAREAALALSAHGYHVATDRELYGSPNRILERLLSIKKDTGVGYAVSTGWEVINAIRQDGIRQRKWHTLYLIAIRTYQPSRTPRQDESIQQWRADILASIDQGELVYLRDTRYDRFLGLLFPEMRELLSRPLTRSPRPATNDAQRVSPQSTSSTSNRQPGSSAVARTNPPLRERGLWLTGRALEDWKRRHPDAAKAWFDRDSK